jgi:hypothetical protein
MSENGKEKAPEPRRYYYLTKSKDSDKWENAISGFCSYPSGIWSLIVRKKKEHKELDKRIIVKQGKDTIRNFPITNKRIEFYIKNRIKLDEILDKKGSIIVEEPDRGYFYEVKVEREIEEGISEVIWESVLDSMFKNAQYLWLYIVRNREKYVDDEKRIRTIDMDTGEEIFITVVDEQLIDLMMNNVLLRGKL